MIMAKKRKTLETQEAIKRLLMLSLAKQGATAAEIGKALGVGASAITNIISFGRKKKRGNK